MRRGVLATVAVLLLASCGSARPDAQLAVAHSALDSARRASAAQYAPVPYESARSKLEVAQQAVQDGDNDKARRLADEASADAHLAEITAQAAVAEQNLTQIEQSEAAGGMSGGAAQPPAVPTPRY